MFYNPPNISKNVFLWFVQIKFQRCHAALGKQVYIYIYVYICMYMFICIYLLFGCAEFQLQHEGPSSLPRG